MPRTAITTPGTRIRFATARQWIEGLEALDLRPPARRKYLQIAAHIAALSDLFIASIDDAAELAWLEETVRSSRYLKRQRGLRAGSEYVRIINAIDRRRTALARQGASPPTASDRQGSRQPDQGTTP